MNYAVVLTMLFAFSNTIDYSYMKVSCHIWHANKKLEYFFLFSLIFKNNNLGLSSRVIKFPNDAPENLPAKPSGIE